MRIAGYMPDLPPTPPSTPGYRPDAPPREAVPCGVPMIAPGTRFGRLVITSLLSDRPGVGSRYMVRCDCGGSRSAYGSELTSGRIKSCGCMQRGRGGGACAGGRRNDSD